MTFGGIMTMTFSINPLRMRTFGITSFSIGTLGIATFSTTTIRIEYKNVTFSIWCWYSDCPYVGVACFVTMLSVLCYADMPNVVLLYVVTSSVAAPFARFKTEKS